MKSLWTTKVSDSSLLPIFLVITLVLHIFTLFRLVVTGFLLSQAGQRADPNLVQLETGHTIITSSEEHNERAAQTIRRFIGETLTLLLTWSPNQPPSELWEASQPLISEAYHQNFINQLQSTTFPDIFLDNRIDIQTALVVQTISLPNNISQGKWHVDVVGHLLFFEETDVIGRSIPFKKRVFVEVTDVPDLPLQIKNDLELEQAVYSLQSAGLSIYKICSFQEAENSNCS